MSGRLPTFFLALGLFVLALCARLPHLDRESLWEDDWLALDRASMPPAEMAHIQKYLGPSRTTYDFHPPLYYALEHLVLAGDSSVFAAKLPGVVAGALTVVLLFLLGQSLFSTGAGLAAGILAAGCLYHVSVSRSVKVYALLLLVFTASQLALWTALRRGRALAWLVSAALGAALLYTAYVGAPTLAGQAAVAAVFLTSRRRFGPAAERTDRRRVLLAGAAFVLAGLAYAPWLPGLLFIQTTFYNPAVRSLARFDWPLFASVLADFGRYTHPAPGPWPYLLAGAAGLGLACALARRQWLQTLFVLVPSLAPVAAIITAKSEMNEILSTRHFILLLPALLLFAGAGLAALGALLPRPAWGRTALAAGLAAALALPQYADLPRLWAHSISYDKELAGVLAVDRGSARTLEFFGYKAPIKRFAAGWYLGDLYRPLRAALARDDAGYLRLMAVQNSLGGDPMPDLPRGVPVANFSISIFRTRAERLGLLRRAPLAVIPGRDGRFTYADDYDGLRVYTEAATLSNLAPDPERSLLAPIGIRPGVVQYDFTVPDGVTVNSAALVAALRLYKRNAKHQAPCFVDIEARREGGPFVRLAQVTDADFAGAPKGQCPSLLEIPIYNNCQSLTRKIDLSAQAAGSRAFSLRLTLSPGLEEGYLHLDGLALDAAVAGKAAPLAGVRATLARLAAADALAVGDPRIPRLLPGPPFALAETEAAAAALSGLAGGPKLLAAYRAANPGETPVAVLADTAGKPAVSVYDPDLAGPRLCLTGREPVREMAGFGERAVALTVTGRLDAPSLALAGQDIDIPVAAPAGTTLAIIAGGPGRLWWRPDFSKANFAAMVPATAQNVRPAPDGDADGGLTCRDSTPCRADFAFVSGFPMKRAFLTVYPRVANDPEGKNAAHVLISSDGEHYSPILSLVSDRSGGWTPLFQPYRLEVPLGQASGHLTLRLEMTGDGAQFWSHARPIDAMGLTIALDSRALAPFDIPSGPAVIRLAHPGTNDACFAADTVPVPFPPEIERQ
ncbi:MAG: glycosyltransferase family 39 protein [Acidobacteriota bacterium]